MLYFAYGCLMDSAQMRKRCPGARALGAARLPGHRLVFTRYSLAWSGGTGHVEPSPADEVWGVLWEISERDERRLDRYERVKAGMYRKDIVEVERGGAGHAALVYLANADGERRPSRRYVAALVRGARTHGLPASYVARLEGLAP